MAKAIGWKSDDNEEYESELDAITADIKHWQLLKDSYAKQAADAETALNKAMEEYKKKTGRDASLEHLKTHTVYPRN
jgi:hypothetical protein